MTMLDFIDKWLGRLDDFLDDDKETIGLKRLALGIFMVSVLKLFLPLGITLTMAVILMLSKEVAYNDKTGEEYPSPKNLLWGLAGIALGLL